jgi:pimeloyl-ACP methyl ester carboxylesterase
MVHGAGGGGWEYRLWAPIFHKAGWNVVSKDLVPAKGGLAKTRVEDYLRQIIAWTPERRGRLVLVGASMGGPLVLAAARRLKPDAIVLVNPVPEIGIPGRKLSPPVVRWANGPFADTVAAMPESDQATQVFAWKHWRDESGAVLNRLTKGLRTPHPRCRVLMIVSGKDTDIAPSLSRATARRLRADIKTLPKMSHVGPLFGREAPSVAAGVLKWLER